ncbi:AAA family ATPase [Thalassolituus oleivorans]|uniref:AAA family ATPase n=1 Tax=Thalassolituus oleivorans TaxID=187493 RepID=UPI00042DD25C|nr:AAA family ATPase [Thalassolituus oleivorans]AHK16171.1 recombinase RecF [Thalassolituus oleivorans R6-15]
MSWKIARIEVSSFKAFKRINLDLGTSSLLTLDGPNGYGKTSIFDAIELLLTGQIKRIYNLFSTLMTKNKSNYDDNLFWNTRNGKKDLSIKIEFVDGERRLVLARHAPVKTFDTKANNRADKFKHFSLYELPDFDSKAYISANKRENEFLDEVFGKNFRENFSFLNYLEQGQNKLLHTRVDERKDALGSLFNISDIATEIENCKSIAAKINRYIGDDERKAKETSLETECTTLREILLADLGSVEYKKLSTIESEPSWDKEDPFPIYDQDVYNQFLESIHKLNDLLPQKAAIRIRYENEVIEADIKRHSESLSRLAKFGSDMSKLDELDKIKNELDRLAKASAIIKRGTSVITMEQARTLPGWATGRLEWFESQITIRIERQTKNVANESAIAELARLKQQLLEEHAKLYPDDKYCPLCGNDWKVHASMLEAVEERAQNIADALDKDGKALVALIGSMATELSTLENYIQGREAVLKPQYNDALHDALKETKSRLPAIQQLAERLRAEGIQITFMFNDDDLVVAARLEDLRNLMRAKKTDETLVPPEDWRQTINAVFKDIQDFFILDPQDLKNKELYIKVKANEAQSIRLQKSLEELQKIQRENEAARKAKDKVNRLYATLKNAEQKYADQTISEIELIFHIYSGRLIQNYQRGLGLFLDSRDGKQLRFLTAEKSEHDAVMSMSTGQVSALSLAFFLSLNKVYSDVPIILIDDPSQSLDEVNIASLTDLLRCELNHCQLIVSAHEEDISAYMRYRFNRAGLTTSSLNMQRLAKEAS